MKSLKIIIKLIKIISTFIRLRPEFKAFILGYLGEAEVISYLSKYSYVLNNKSECLQKSAYTDKIWQLWFQGIEQAPKIVKKCMETVRNFSNGRDIIVLDNKNIENYVSIPGYIYDKKKKGYISNVNFSDVLRACLLAEHGGTWLDSTVMLTDKIPNYILKSSLFCFSTTPKELRGVGNVLASSWFIHSIPNHIIMQTVKDLFFEYWKHENSSRHCYYFHLLFALSVSSNEDCKKEWGKVPFFSNVPPHILQIELFKEYNEERFEQIKQMSSIHKLTFYGGKEFDTDKKNTFYDVLTNGNGDKFRVK